MDRLCPSLRARVLASALVLGTGAAALPFGYSDGALIATAQAQGQFSISFSTFRHELADYGDWVYSDRWGMVWLPDVGPDFHPYYTDGRWVPTREYGYTWVSDYEWGDIPFHYGRWVNDPYDGWMWVPGYMWSPGWVVWRGNPRYMGWMPLPPDDDFLRGSETISFRFSFGGRAANYDDFDGYYGYARWYGRDYDRDRFARNWVFVGADRFGERDYRPYAVRQPQQIVNVFRETRNVTNYTVVNNYIVNRSADGAQPRSGTRRGGDPRPAAEVLRKPNFVRNIDSGRQVERQQTHETPRGSGVANSAPKPVPAVVQNLSERAKRRGGGSGRLLTRETIGSSPLGAAPAAMKPAPQVDRPALREDRPREDRSRDNRANEARAKQERATQERVNQERVNQERANQKRADQERANQERADQDRSNDERRARDNQAKEQRAKENQARENQAKENQARENRARENQARDNQARENRAVEERRANQQRTNEQRVNEERAKREPPATRQPAALTNEAPASKQPNRDENRGKGRGGDSDDDKRGKKGRD